MAHCEYPYCNFCHPAAPTLEMRHLDPKKLAESKHMLRALIATKKSHRKINMNKFKVGDRVAGYEYSYSGRAIRHKGKILEINNDLVIIRPDGWEDDRCVYHYKQCRLLKKKERKRIWINKSELRRLLATNSYITGWQTDDNGWIEFVEVKRKQK